MVSIWPYISTNFGSLGVSPDALEPSERALHCGCQISKIGPEITELWPQMWQNPPGGRPLRNSILATFAFVVIAQLFVDAFSIFDDHRGEHIVVIRMTLNLLLNWQKWPRYRAKHPTKPQISPQVDDVAMTAEKTFQVEFFYSNPTRLFPSL